MERKLTLRIKKIFLKKILLGEKTSEFRKESTFYNLIFTKKYDLLVLHYQQSEKVVIKIKSIKKIKSSKKLLKNPLIGTIYCWKIDLGPIISHTP